MAVFGAPVAHSDDAERAVRAGLRVLEAVAELRAQGFALGARAAVNTGEAIVSVNRRDAGEALAIGDVVNTASRLQSAAPIGSLVVGAETRRATRHAIAYEELPPSVAKGKASPVETWRATHVISEPAVRPEPLGRFVGRTRELDLIRSVWRQATLDSRPHLITVVGTTGDREVAARAARSPRRSKPLEAACSAGAACRTRSGPATTLRRRSCDRRSGSSTRTHRRSHATSSTRASPGSCRLPRARTPRATSGCSSGSGPASQV